MFLLKGFAKVEAEMNIFCLSYNLCRAINMKGVPTLLTALRQGKYGLGFGLLYRLFF